MIMEYMCRSMVLFPFGQRRLVEIGLHAYHGGCDLHSVARMTRGL